MFSASSSMIGLSHRMRPAHPYSFSALSNAFKSEIGIRQFEMLLLALRAVCNTGEMDMKAL